MKCLYDQLYISIFSYNYIIIIVSLSGLGLENISVSRDKGIDIKHRTKMIVFFKFKILMNLQFYFDGIRNHY